MEFPGGSAPARWQCRLGVEMNEDEQQKKAAATLELLKTVKLEEAIAILQSAASLNPDLREAVLEYLENEQGRPVGREEHEPRMRATMKAAARVTGLVWDDRSPGDHPFQARLDGVLLSNGRRVAIVELESKNRKQIDGAVLDLLTHPDR